MKFSFRKSTLFALAGLLVSGALFAQAGSRVASWTVPPYRASGTQGGYTTMADISDAAVFVAVTPCRVIDTRFASGTGHGSPALVGQAIRTFDMNAGSCTGIPEGVAALSLSIAAILPGADGFLKAWPTGTTEPLVSQLNFLAGEVVANAAIVPVDAFDRINILANVTTHIYVDVNGYFTDTLNTETNLWLEGSSQAQVVYVANLNTTIGGGISAIRGLMFTSQAGASGVVGEVVSSGATHGVTGKNTSAAAGASGVRGVIGAVPSLYKHAGVRGESSTGATGVLGLINNSQGEAVTGFLLNNTNGAILSGGHLGFHAGNRPCHNR